jgi:hypothetical protein
MALDTTKNAKVNIEVDASMEVKSGVAQVRLSAREGNLLYFKENGMLSLKKIVTTVETIDNIGITINTSARHRKPATTTSTKKYTVWAPDGSGDQLQVGNGGVIYHVQPDGTNWVASAEEKAYAKKWNSWPNPTNYNSSTRKNMTSGGYGGAYMKDRSKEIEVSYSGSSGVTLQ